jgi:hypothetical protein
MGQTLGPLLAGLSVASLGFATTFTIGFVAAVGLAAATAVLSARVGLRR